MTRPDPVSRPRLGRGPALALSFASAYAAHVGLPLTIASRGRRVGWGTGQPGLLNRLGLVPVGLGAAGLGWCIVLHYRPGETVAISLTPEFLIDTGPYRFSRNPMYVAEQAMWAGWSLFFGSPRLLGYGLGLAAALSYVVAREERTLQRCFGASWKQYADRVPRWL